MEVSSVQEEHSKMDVQTLAPSLTLPAGEIVAIGVSAEEYLARYAEHHYEWVKGAVIKMSPVSEQHDLLTAYFRQLLDAYFAVNKVGRVRSAPFVMRLDATEAYREPDLQVILNTNPGQLTDTAMIGPADICIEVVSPESGPRDYGDNFIEYEKAGVKEYWIVDPLRRRCDFNRLAESGVYAALDPDDQGFYRTPLLPHLALHVPTLWQEELPDFFAIGQAVQAMLDDQE
jgi:Uma2 family endonuclease